MSNRLKEFLKRTDVKELIEKNKFGEVYRLYGQPYHSELTEMFKGLNVNPFDYLTLSDVQALGGLEFFK